MKPGDAVISNDEMQIAEQNSDYLGITSLQLMEAVGRGIAQEIATRVKPKSTPRIDVVAGTGRNGGDGLSVARHLVSLGYHVKVTLVGKTKDVEDYAARHQLEPILQMNDSVEFRAVQDSSELKPIGSDFIVDALVGTGVRGALRQPLLEAVRMVNKSTGFKIALDLPSGLDTDTGEAHGEAVKADLTITLHKMKQGLPRAREYAGEIIVLPIGIPPEAEEYAGPGDFKILWKPRPSNSHKGDFGRLLVIGGSENFTGAPAFSAMAGAKIGTDLVYVASPEKTAQIIASYSPDLITIKLPGDHLKPTGLSELDRWVKVADALVLGPGIGLHEETAEFVWKTISLAETLNKPLVLDADALKIFGRKKRQLKTVTVMTPHAGEFAALSGEKMNENLESRIKAVEHLAGEIGTTIVQKGHIDIISNGKRTKLNRTHNPYMTVGGTGDVLTGIIGAFMAQHIEPFRACVAGAFLNGLAGDMLIAQSGPTVSPSKLVEYVPKAMRYCIEGPPFPRIQ